MSRKLLLTAPLLLGVALVTLALYHVQAQAGCPAAELRVQTTADARADGYLLAAPGASYFRHAAYDLIQGRIRFFELARHDGALMRYTLADTRSAGCVPRQLFDAELEGLPMPADHCIGAVAVASPASRYVIEGYPQSRQDIPEALVVRERDGGPVLASLQIGKAWGLPELLPERLPEFVPGLAPGNRDTCRTTLLRSDHPLWNISSFVFVDQQGATASARSPLPESDYREGELLPALDEVRRQLALQNRLDTRSCSLPGWMGATEVHALELERGPLEVDARLDTDSRKAGVVLVDVYVPDKAVVLLARAHGPTLWHIHESSRSSLVAVLLRGHHGQAVEGIGPYTRVLMSTQLHNPYTNCSERELSEIESRITRQYGVRSRQRQSQATPPQVRYGIGEPMPDGAELFHLGLSIEDFLLKDD